MNEKLYIVQLFSFAVQKLYVLTVYDGGLRHFTRISNDIIVCIFL